MRASRRLVFCAASALVMGCGQGPAGEAGAAGGTGSGGPVGATGATGAVGASGPAGDAGAAGEAGAAGATGATGPVGASVDAASIAIAGTIGGTVVGVSGDDAGSTPLSGVTVTVALGAGVSFKGDAGIASTVTTGLNGSFSVPNLPTGDYTLTFAKAGYVTKSVAVYNPGGAPVSLLVAVVVDTAVWPAVPTFALAVTDPAGARLDPFAVGFGTRVMVAVTGLAEDGGAVDPASFTYDWSVSTAKAAVSSGGEVASTSGGVLDAGIVVGASSVTFTTMSIPQAKGGESDDRTAVGGFVGRLGVLAINPDETGRYTVSMTIADQAGHKLSASVPLQSSWQVTGLANVPVGVPVYLEGDTYAEPNWLLGPSLTSPIASWSWTVVSCTDTSNQNGLLAGNPIVACSTDGGAPFLAGANTQFPSFTPPMAGTYVFQVAEAPSAPDGGGDGGAVPPGQVKNVTVYAGSWTGFTNNVTAGDCGTCHQTNGAASIASPPPDNSPVQLGMIPSWQNTAHATALQRDLDGLSGAPFTKACMACHTTGWTQVGDPLTAPSRTVAQSGRNDGFYYNLMNLDGGVDGGLWSFPATLSPGSYAAMAAGWPALGALGSVECEGCHGPGGGAAAFHNTIGTTADHDNLWSARVAWGAGVCSSCHQESTAYSAPGLWGISPHSSVARAIANSSVEAFVGAPQGATDPAVGVQSCGRCHSAQGFARYVAQLGNGATGRYDFLTTDEQRLSDAGTNAPDAAFLAAVGLRYAGVEPITCQACHDPHSNGAYAAFNSGWDAAGPLDCTAEPNVGLSACMQLRAFDVLPGLPNGQVGIVNVGAGAVCMACHNSHQGEHTDTVNSAPYFETADMSSAADALFGFNTFFTPRYTPSAHMGVSDTCATCHVALPTASELDAGFTSNHNFTTDLSICTSCHAPGAVNPEGIQSEYALLTQTIASALAEEIPQHIYNVAGLVGNKRAGISAIAGTFALCAEVVGVTPGPTASFGGGPFVGNVGSSAAFVTGVPFVLPPAFVYIAPNTITNVTLDPAMTSATFQVGTPVPPYSIFDARDVKMTSPSPAPAAALTSFDVNLATVWVVTPVGSPVTASNNPCLAGARNADAGTQPGLGYPNGNRDGYWGAYGPAATPLTSGMYLFPPTDVPAKAAWNYSVLTTEGSGGIHNYGWTVLAGNATIEALQGWVP